ncbi:uncharacterized protein J4E84_006705 [Alternaria hordeiaustralica]|uniref:uncharacterized protein n=1 Tax=Alternaria hordeiaustralica TaxID=1187925 RepID=UPI0020C4FA31|nr:uncharacterized protein J4E84_006705 [Alternaria hordeiaustralica]KAI4683865.1 hypothetical protein J4E84_006705 [Alternaria hordeiaustralica]
MIGRNTEEDNFHSLVQEINKVLGPSNGIDSDDVDENELQELMKAYTSEESEWKKYYFPSETLPYTRNVVDKGNGKSNLVQSPILESAKVVLIEQLILVWGPGKKSPIHDHANAHCIMKVLKGSLTETRFATPTEDDAQNQRPMTKTQETTFAENDVTYMADTLVYTPPNAATYGCNVFKEDTSGVVHNTTCHFYSEYGVRTGRK